MSVLIETSKGDIVVDLFTDRCPITTKNFLKLCKIKYFNNCLFFNIKKNFMVQTGDPTNTGKGGESVYRLLFGEQARYFEDEIHKDLKHNRPGLLSMANAGLPHTNGSQFFITTSDEPLAYLDEKHTVFGEVAEGLDTTLAKINSVYTDETGRPYQIVRIRRTVILDDPFPDPPGLEIPNKSPPRALDPHLEKSLLPEDADEVSAVVSEKELMETLRQREMRTRSAVLEAVGDIPDADIKPPENVLFVCKLNPVTQDSDLEIIFSRFGKIKSCEVIRDRKTKESLCYAFIEFYDVESCEEAYFKMENVLIDDRRVHVDFSQSVAKLWNKFRRGEGDRDRSQWNTRRS